jgi:MFS superfamily sulfate permease-like transporter
MKTKMTLLLATLILAVAAFGQSPGPACNERSATGAYAALGEIAAMLDLPGGGHGTLGKVWNDFRQIGQTNAYAVVIALCVLVVTVGAKMVSKKIPGSLIAVIGAIAISRALDLGSTSTYSVWLSFAKLWRSNGMRNLGRSRTLAVS